MTLFIIIAVVLVGLGTLMLLWPTLSNDRSDSAVDDLQQSQASLAILQESLAVLNAERAAGQISEAAFTQQKEELEKRTVTEVLLEKTVAPTAPSSSILKLPLYLALVLPILIVGLYFLLGNPAAVNPPVDPRQEKILEMVRQLESRTKSEPTVVQNWIYLAQTYSALNRLDEAKKAFTKAVELDPKNSDVLADLADLVSYQNKSMNEEVMGLLRRALLINPNNPKALALNGTAAFEKQDYVNAIKNWEKAIPYLDPNDAGFAQGLNASIQEAKNLLNPLVANAPANVATNAAPKVAANSAQTISGKVMLSPKVSSQINSGDTVFIYARALEGPRMPLAIIKSTAGQLPLNFTLSDEQAMSPELKLSKFKEVVLMARISKSGNAIAEKGDLIGVISKVALGEKNVQLVIQDVQP